jgi:hypothetical protein
MGVIIINVFQINIILYSNYSISIKSIYYYYYNLNLNYLFSINSRIFIKANANLKSNPKNYFPKAFNKNLFMSNKFMVL